MEVYHGKLVELLSIQKEPIQTYIQIRISTEEESSFFWQVDSLTAENLMTVFDHGDKYKYRLSFHYSWDMVEKQYKSYLTKTYRDYSEKVYFTCSEKYVECLNSLKSSLHSNKMYRLPFLTKKIPSILESDNKQNQDKSKHKKQRPTYALISAVLISTIFITILGYAGHSYLNKTVFAQKTQEKSISHPKKLNVRAVKNVGFARKETSDSNNPIIPAASLNKVRNYSIPEGSIALTFDDGPSKYTALIVDILKKSQVGGTFFFIGQNVKKHPEYVQYVNSHGYSIGNHSMTHTDFTKLSFQQEEKELIETNELIEKIIHDKVSLFRPPYGANDASTINLMNRHHDKMVLWNKDPRDWQNHNPTQILHYIMRNHESGSIIVLHESQTVVDALPQIITYLKGQHLKIVNLH